MPEPDRLNFEAVLDAARSGGAWAWDRLVRPIDGKLQGYVRRLGARDPEDVVGETWLEVARRIHDFEGDEEQFRSWVFLIAHHRLIDARRRSSSRRQHPESLKALERLGTTEHSAEHAYFRAVPDDRIQEALNALPTRQREVLVLRFLVDLSPPEVAEVMGTSAGAVHVLQHRAIKNLRKILDRA